MTILNNLKPDKVFFTSDTHFGHKAIIDYCKRPFATVDYMDDMLISNWNEVVSDDCTVFHLGDFAFGGPPYWESIRSRLRGHIYLIKGNHKCYKMFL
jgi:calcineurin-like phosphoesterase family protein